MAIEVANIVRNTQPLTTLIGNKRFLWNNIPYDLPENIANGSEVMQNCFIHILRLVRDDTCYMPKIPKDKIEAFALKRAAEKIKNLPPDPTFLKIYMVAHVAVIIFLIAITGSQIAKL